MPSPDRNHDDHTEESQEESPFVLPPVTSGYPLEESEQETIEKLLREHRREREAASA